MANLVPPIRDGSWDSVRKAFQMLTSIVIGSQASPTFASLTLTGLTASRLVWSDSNKLLTSKDLIDLVAGTTDRITVADDAAGGVTIDLAANTQTLLDAFNGTFLETIDFTVAESGGTVTGSLEQDGTGDLTQRFSDGYSTLDCTSPQCTIDLTAYVGTDAVPKEVFVYILQSAKTTLVASNSDWPATEHIKVANLVLRSAATTGTDGALVNRNWNDHAQDSTAQGHITHIEAKLRQGNADWKSGVALTLKDAAGNALATSSSSTAVELVTAIGAIYQLHKQTFPATDMYVTATDDAHVVNQPTDEGGAYETTVDLVTDVTHYVDGSAAGVVIGANKYFNLVVWGVQNRTGEASHIMVNLPTGQYTVEANAISDIDGLSVYDIPTAFKGTGFLIARLTFRKIAGPQWTYIAIEDLRGLTPSTSAGVGISTTDHALLANLTFATAGHTGFQAQGDVLDDLNTLGAIASDGQIIVGTGAGAFAYESGATARTSLGLGTVDSPTFAGLTATGNISLGFGDLVSEQNPDAANAIRLKGTASDVGVVIGHSTGYFLVWNAADDTPVFYVNNVGDTDIAGDLTVGGSIIGHVIGTNTQAWDASLDSIAALTYASDSFIKLTAEDTYAVRTLAEVKTDLSLNLVENTALSTWAGTTNVTTLGTIATGSWAATTIPINKGGTGQITAQAAIDALTAVSGATNEHVLTKDTATGNAVFKAAAGGADAFTVKIDAGATAGYIGAANNDGVLRAGTGLSYVDGGDFVTLDLDINALTADATPVGSTDYVATYDASASVEKKVLLDNFHRYVDRGDPATGDYTLASFTTDGTWRDLDLSGIVPAGAVAVLLSLGVTDNAANSNFQLRKNGMSNAASIASLRTQVANIRNDNTVTVACDTNRVVEYKADNLTWSAIFLTVMGWWLN